MLTEEQGIKAIIALQASAGITEPEERARSEWRAFSDSNKRTTEQAHKIVCGGFEDADT